MNELVQIKNLIYEIRGCKVMVDSDLADLYEIETKMLNRAVKRNIPRFPANFMFQLTKEEWQDLRYQFGTFKNDIRKYTPYVFTEQGVAMLATILKTPIATKVSIAIMDAFVEMRHLIVENKDIYQSLNNINIIKNNGT